MKEYVKHVENNKYFLPLSVHVSVDDDLKKRNQEIEKQPDIYSLQIRGLGEVFIYLKPNS